MKLALCAKVIIDPARLRKSRWVHDTAHEMLASIRAAQDAARRRRPRRH